MIVSCGCMLALTINSEINSFVEWAVRLPELGGISDGRLQPHCHPVGFAGGVQGNARHRA